MFTKHLKLNSAYRYGLLLIAIGVFAACTHTSEPEKDVQNNEQKASKAASFFAGLSELCGTRYVGEMTFPLDGQDSFAGKVLVANIQTCTDHEIRVPFIVGEDTSRTCVFAMLDSGVTLKHDHRHADGSLDDVSDYGGHSNDAGTALSQSFPADVYTQKLIPEASTNVWSVSLSADLDQLTYHLERHNKPRFTAVLQRVE